MNPIIACISYNNTLCPIILFLYFRLGCLQSVQESITGRSWGSIGILCVMTGSLLYGDWQAVNSDPCLLPNTTTNPQAPSNSGGNMTESLCLRDLASNSSLLTQQVERCESLSSSVDECFWNRQSRVTGNYCYSCLGVCLSLSRSQNIYQLSMAVMLQLDSCLFSVRLSYLTSLP